MINQIDTLADIELEGEYLASQIARGYLFPNQYIDIRSNFSQLPMVDTSPEVSILMLQIQKKIVSSFGTLNDKDMEKFSAGEHPELLAMIEILKSKVDEETPQYENALYEQFTKTMIEMEKNLQDQDFAGMGQAFNIAQADSDWIDKIRTTHASLLKLNNRIDYLMQNYGSFKIKIKKPKIKVGVNTEYQLYINNLIQNPEFVTSDLNIAICVGRVINQIKILIPNIAIKKPLDPFKLDESECALEILTYPKDFYSKCETEQIISTGIGQIFGQCYPAYYQKFIDMYLEDFDKMDYQKQINFRKCFGIPENDSDLLQMSTKYIALSYI